MTSCARDASKSEYSLLVGDERMSRDGAWISRTAMLVAGYRARATAAPHAVCRDEWAARLAGDEGVKLSERMDTLFPTGELWLAIRTRVIDEEVTRSIAAGVRQIVILGAGLDTRAARLAHEGVRFFEVDRVEMQREKLSRLKLLRDYPMSAATYVSCNFETESFVAQLAGSGFSVKEPALFVWEGVVYYLTEPAVRSTLVTISKECDPHAAVIFDYVGKKLVEGRVRDLDDLGMRGMVADLGEPLHFGIDHPIPLLYECGFRKVRVTSFDEACLNLTGTYDRARKFRFQGLVLASREREFG